RPPPRPAVFPYTTLFRSLRQLLRIRIYPSGEPLRVEQLQQRREALPVPVVRRRRQEQPMLTVRRQTLDGLGTKRVDRILPPTRRSEEHTSELQSRENLVC